jgi:hypothetical protein
MDGWTTPIQRNTGDLITSSIWNTDLKDNLRYLKGLDGQVTIQDDLLPSSASLTVGQGANPWGEGHFYSLYAGPRYAVHKGLREVTIIWESDSDTTYPIEQGDSGAGASFQMGGFGQSVLKVDDDQAGAKWIYGQAEQNDSLDNSFNADRNPYMRAEFAINNSDPVTLAFIGFRTTPGGALPLPAAESYAGLHWTGAIWIFENGDGAGNQDTSGTQTVAANTRYVIEIYINGGSQVEYWKNGVLIKTSTTALPSGALEWCVLLKSAGGGGAGDNSLLTLGKMIFQEDLS